MARYGDNHKGGRPKGSYTIKKLTAIAFARDVCNDEEYRQNLLHRARTGQLGSMEATIWAYAFGKPLERVDLTIAVPQEDYTQLSIEELACRAAELTTQLREAQALQDAIDAEFVSAETPALVPATEARRDET